VIAHVVLFQPRSDITPKERDDVLAALAAAARDAPSVRSCRVGRRVKHGLPGYEQVMPPYEFAAIIEFDDADGLREYLRHPAHQAIGQYFTTAAASALAYDFELRNLDEFAGTFER
jgi:hypothetical protein